MPLLRYGYRRVFFPYKYLLLVWYTASPALILQLLHTFGPWYAMHLPNILFYERAEHISRSVSINANINVKHCCILILIKNKFQPFPPLLKRKSGHLLNTPMKEV